jgi:long-chain acyl-CoA synthetase
LVSFAELLRFARNDGEVTPMTDAQPGWLGSVLPMRSEAHFRDRVVRCFVERPRSTHALLADALARNPDGEAIVCGAERLTYREFDAVVARAAAGLVARGIARGDRVGMLLGNGTVFPVVLFAALRLGAIAVPISIREQAPGLAYMLAHCGAKVVVHDADLVDRLPDARAAPALAHRIAVRPGAPCDQLELMADAAPPVIARSASDEAIQKPAVVSGLLRSARNDDADGDEEDTAVILYTSGTTGRPKGAMLTHLGICHSAMHYECCMAIDARDRSVIAVPMSHVTGVVALIATMVRAAATMIVMPAFKAADFIALAERERMTHTLLVPAMYNLCLLEPSFAAADLRSWRRRLRRRADAAGDNRAFRRQAAGAFADECVRVDRDHLARDADAAFTDRGAPRQRRLRRALRRDPGDGRSRPRAAAGPGRRDLDARPDGRQGLLG